MSKLLYVPLHVHTDVSPDGLGTIEHLVGTAASLGAEALAMTDHGSLGNAVSFWAECTKHNIKPILGIEAYLAYKEEVHHVTLLAMNEEGFNQLADLSTEAHWNWDGGRPLMTIEMMEKHAAGKDNLFALTGCVSSALHKGSYDDGLEYVSHLVNAFGRKNVGIEVMFVDSHDSWSRPIQIAKDTGLPLIVTNDTHFPKQDEYLAHQLSVRARKGYTYNSSQLWLKTADEIVARAKRYVDPEIIKVGLRNTVILGNRVETWDMSSEPTLPTAKDSRRILLGILKSRFREVTEGFSEAKQQQYLDRLKMEFKTIDERGFLNYFYILKDIIDWARTNGIRVGPGRGSGAGSLVLYLLGITTVDPIRHGLLFARFLNVARDDYPDVDVDFESARRDEVLAYANRKWGAHPICTYNKYSHRSLVRDIGRILKIDPALTDKASEYGENSKYFTQFCMEGDRKTLVEGHRTRTIDIYNSLLGQIRHKGKHAGGVVITDLSIPLERVSDIMAAAWTESGASKELSQVGIVKFDLLGITALSQLQRMVELAGTEPPAEPTDDPNVMQIFQNGDVAGIFQWAGSDGIRELTMRIHPNKFIDLPVINALYRPGALDAGTAEKYPEFKKSPRKIEPRIDKILEETHGVIVFQEQMMAIFQEVAGGSLEEADLARRVILKSKPGDKEWERKIESLKTDFFANGKRNGFTTKTLSLLWDEVFTHSRYSFNKSHSVAYSFIAWQMAWFKAYHRPAFYTAMAQYDSSNAQTYLYEAVKQGVRIEPPHVNVSARHHMLRDNKIYLPIGEVAYLGETGVDAIISAREKDGEFTSFEDFDKRIARRACNSRARTNLYRLGAFKDLTGDPKEAGIKLEEIPLGSGFGDEKFRTQFDILGYIVPNYDIVSAIEEMSKDLKDNELVGFIADWHDKSSKYGPYRVFSVSPNGSFWMRDDMEVLDKGDLVMIEKNGYGKAVNYKQIDLKTIAK